MVLSQRAFLSMWSPFPFLHIPAWLTLVTGLNLVVYLALAPPNSWDVVSWSPTAAQPALCLALCRGSSKMLQDLLMSLSSLTAKQPGLLGNQG